MVRLRSLRAKLLLVTALTVAVVAAYPIWTPPLGAFLVRCEDPVPADMIVVLAGDGYGHRILKAAELARQGFASRILVSGAEGYYGFYESDLAIRFAVSRGYPPECFVAFPHRANSTDEEARAVLPELRRLDVRSFILVTSDYHTRRAGSIFRSLGPDFKIRVVAAPDAFFHADDWWRSRQGRKTVLLEWSKTIATLIGL